MMPGAVYPHPRNARHSAPAGIFSENSNNMAAQEEAATPSTSKNEAGCHSSSHAVTLTVLFI